jgi:hypothetical protein
VEPLLDRREHRRLGRSAGIDPQPRRDEAQNLPMSALEELRMLSNFQFGGQALLQIFLLGQPEFRDALAASIPRPAATSRNRSSGLSWVETILMTFIRSRSICSSRCPISVVLPAPGSPVITTKPSPWLRP